MSSSTNRQSERAVASDDSDGNGDDTPPTAWSNEVVWVRDAELEDADLHPAFLPKTYHHNDDRDGDELVWIKWQSTGDVAQKPRCRIHLELPKRSRRRAKQDITIAEREMLAARERKSKKRAAASPAAPTKKRARSSKRSAGESHTNDEPSAPHSPLSPFLRAGINSARNSSCARRQLQLNCASRGHKGKVGPLSRFLVEGVDSCRNSSRDVAVGARCSRGSELKKGKAVAADSASSKAEPPIGVKHEEDQYECNTDVEGEDPHPSASFVPVKKESES